MRKINFRMNELLKYETIKELVDHKGNKNRAAQKLGISKRQIWLVHAKPRTHPNKNTR